MHFLLDENVPHSVAGVLERSGHSVEFVVEILPRGAADPIVATLSETIGAVLVSADNDFKSLAPRIQIGRGRYRRLSRIALLCGEPQAAQRIEKAMSLVEAEFEIAQQSPDRRMIVAIGRSYIRTER
jgi:hypothetical protein